MRRLLALVVLVVPFAAARAQNTGNTGNNPNPSATVTGSASASASVAEGAHNITGYGYSDRTPTVTQQQPRTFTVRSGTRSQHRPTTPVVSGPVATLPGFEMLGEGGSRLFVELTQTVPVEERHARGILTYVLKGAHVTVHNNQNPLVTVHFNTPVTRARLVPAGSDLLFVIDLRANVTPTWKLNPAKEGSAVLAIDFPKGSYITAQ
jgi:hypothetical protein